MASSAPMNVAGDGEVEPTTSSPQSTTLPSLPLHRRRADRVEMSGQKRDYNGMEKKPQDGGHKKADRQQKTVPVVRNEYTPMFERFRDELDQHHERRERIVKASRDITALSKKIIFALQRVRKIQQELPSDIQKNMDSLLDQISKLLASIAPETQGINRYRYDHNLSCMEELVEALTFAHYLKTQSLISFNELSAVIEGLACRGSAPSESKEQADANVDENSTPDAVTSSEDAAKAPVVAVTEQDYIYGIFDLTGEMMRFATTSTALTRNLAAAEGDDASARPRTILQDMQHLRSFIEMLPQKKGKSWNNKLSVLRQSVRKVENIGYGMVVRGGERAKGWVPDEEVDAGADE